MTAPTDLARLGLAIADVMDRTGSPSSAGIVRQLAALAIDQGAALDAVRPARTDEACPVCGQHVAQPAHGRRRTYCTEACRRSAQRARRARNAQNGSLVTSALSTPPP